ncbi:MAG: hypothetical protein KatS3mg115_1907 [Candidatus Poribacteria bacterium]|nr:MAG: hypothetical protein KatS3mg115_1907 [Candidatus Poribacteria bacterium]
MSSLYPTFKDTGETVPQKAQRKQQESQGVGRPRTFGGERDEETLREQYRELFETLDPLRRTEASSCLSPPERHASPGLGYCQPRSKTHPTWAHLELAERARGRFRLDEVWLELSPRQRRQADRWSAAGRSGDHASARRPEPTAVGDRLWLAPAVSREGPRRSEALSELGASVHRRLRYPGAPSSTRVITPTSTQSFGGCFRWRPLSAPIGERVAFRRSGRCWSDRRSDRSPHRVFPLVLPPEVAALSSTAARERIARGERPAGCCAAGGARLYSSARTLPLGDPVNGVPCATTKGGLMRVVIIGAGENRLPHGSGVDRGAPRRGHD